MGKEATIIYFILFGIGFLFFVVGWIRVIIRAFTRSILWGLSVTFIPGVVFLFYIIYSDSRKFLYMKLFGLLLIFIAVLFMDQLNQREWNKNMKIIDKLRKGPINERRTY